MEKGLADMNFGKVQIVKYKLPDYEETDNEKSD